MIPLGCSSKGGGSDSRKDAKDMLIMCLTTITQTLTCVVSCEGLNLTQSFLGHVMSKNCQYVTNDSKVCVGLTIVSITKTQFILSEIITWTKKGVKD